MICSIGGVHAKYAESQLNVNNMSGKHIKKGWALLPGNL